LSLYSGLLKSVLQEEGEIHPDEEHRHRSLSYFKNQMDLLEDAKDAWA
jgi:hypothetical protein